MKGGAAAARPVRGVEERGQPVRQEEISLVSRVAELRRIGNEVERRCVAIETMLRLLEQPAFKVRAVICVYGLSCLVM